MHFINQLGLHVWTPTTSRNISVATECYRPGTFKVYKMKLLHGLISKRKFCRLVHFINQLWLHVWPPNNINVATGLVTSCNIKRSEITLRIMQDKKTASRYTEESSPSLTLRLEFLVWDPGNVCRQRWSSCSLPLSLKWLNSSETSSSWVLLLQ